MRKAKKAISFLDGFCDDDDKRNISFFGRITELKYCTEHHQPTINEAIPQPNYLLSPSYKI